ncbi:hypothetical protein M885DRAFT_514808 [Pelagophyceae sp. CCMP2097]|nr:hypothetical protein M885DRAFT_514808 [Pelagophyceae sp. CCMP2097]
MLRAYALLFAGLRVSSETYIEPIDLPTEARQWKSFGVEGMHVGCGLSLMPGALNTDITGILAAVGKSSLERPFVAVNIDADTRRYFYQHDALQPYPLPPASFDWIFLEHFIEHIERDAALGFIREARRLVRPGGVIRVSTPDLALYVRGYLDPNKTFLTKHHEMMTTGPMAGKNSHLRPTGAASFADLFRGYGHADGHIYDHEELLALFHESGILAPLGDCVVERSAFKESRHIAHVAAFDDAVKAHESLYVELICGTPTLRGNTRPILAADRTPPVRAATSKETAPKAASPWRLPKVEF